jgi:FkbM family methyltransferase
MKIYYGVENEYQDITNYFIKDQIFIPSNDADRSLIFGDPKPNLLKHIKIEDDERNIQLYSSDESVYLTKKNQKFKNEFYDLTKIHSKLDFKHGNLFEEYPEQCLTCQFIRPNDTVLEIGGNIGRNSCIIASILNDSSNLVVLESNKDTATKLKENRDLNGFNFGIISKALSKIELFQWKWKTISKDILEQKIQEPDEEWFPIETISWAELKKLYPYEFNVLVLDCEGSFYYILKDEPEFLKGIEKILIENDFDTVEQKNFVSEKFIQEGFYCCTTLKGSWPPNPLNDCFYEVWLKSISN